MKKPVQISRYLDPRNGYMIVTIIFDNGTHVQHKLSPEAQQEKSLEEHLEIWMKNI